MADERLQRCEKIKTSEGSLTQCYFAADEIDPKECDGPGYKVIIDKTDGKPHCVRDPFSECVAILRDVISGMPHEEIIFPKGEEEKSPTKAHTTKPPTTKKSGNEAPNPDKDASNRSKRIEDVVKVLDLLRLIPVGRFFLQI